MPDLPLDYQRPARPDKRKSTLLILVATLVALLVFMVVFFFIGESVVERLAPRERNPLFGLLVAADAVLSCLFAVLSFLAIIEEPKDFEK